MIAMFSSPSSLLAWVAAAPGAKPPLLREAPPPDGAELGGCHAPERSLDARCIGAAQDTCEAWRGWAAGAMGAPGTPKSSMGTPAIPKGAAGRSWVGAGGSSSSAARESKAGSGGGTTATPWPEGSGPSGTGGGGPSPTSTATPAVVMAVAPAARPSRCASPPWTFRLELRLRVRGPASRCLLPTASSKASSHVVLASAGWSMHGPMAHSEMASRPQASPREPKASCVLTGSTNRWQRGRVSDAAVALTLVHVKWAVRSLLVLATTASNASAAATTSWCVAGVMAVWLSALRAASAASPSVMRVWMATPGRERSGACWSCGLTKFWSTSAAQVVVVDGAPMATAASTGAR
mmetsp:Transcript_22306/g.84636  ORF Transcript_22306/g.84636 Transcript_22306/m.84636 type:complete len:350 (-) Transcript_22306:1769-2818(-)